MANRHYSFIDKCCLQIDTALRTVFGKPVTTGRNNPAQSVASPKLTAAEIRHSQGYMRVNHCGEVCAQALYQGQALTARSDAVKIKMTQAAAEENDHLQWCNTRLTELGSHTSYLNPLWYVGSLALGITAGLVGDQWNLGFLAETEKQVTEHLHTHLEDLPKQDLKSRAIVQQMAIDENEHAELAKQAGAAELPAIIKKLMWHTSNIMKNTAYYL